MDKKLTCVVCGKPLTKKQIYNHQQCCSQKCSGKNPERKKRMKSTSVKRYGVEHHMKSDEYVEKIKETWRNKTQAEIDDINARVEQTNLERCGFRRPLQDGRKRQKLFDDNLERYGHGNPFQVPVFKEKIKKIFTEKYGVENPMMNEDIMNRSLDTRRPVHFFKMKESVKEYVVPLFDEKEYTNIFAVYRWKCVKCGNEFEQHIHKTQLDGSSCYIPRCLNCFPYVGGYSYCEKEVRDFIKTIYSGEIVENDRTVIGPKELDLHLPDKKLAIEFNGLYWHSLSCGIERNYHLNKTEKCLKEGVRLIHIFEFDWLNKKELIKDKLRAVFNVERERVQARRCTIKEITTKEKDEFLKRTHLQGKDHSSIKIGLFYNGELNAVMTFGKPRYNKKYEYELIRYATNKHVVGGAGKLLRYFEKKYKPTSLITYADRCWSNGDMYRKIGFEEKMPSPPSYVYANGELVLSRHQAQKHKLKKILGDKFNPELSESENMALNKFYKIYDCGNLVFVKYADDKMHSKCSPKH